MNTIKCFDDMVSIISAEVHERHQLAVPGHQNPSTSITWKKSLFGQYTPNILNDRQARYRYVLPIEFYVKIEPDRNCF